ncbi:efflux RND transporter periplasmic adaptor subunit [Paenibacillus shunpengii]|uniref:Efflux RND transporter periplasmic adaptor subunit n=1 Tax=Paenibacillus shunpengii TaxID=2054424 RepID=A0ABW5SN00_9BACL
MSTKKRTLRLIIILFFTVLLLLTFLSNTIQSLTLPKVAVEKAAMGSLDLSVSEEGYLQPAYSTPLMSAGNWTILKVHAEKGDHVSKGDPLITFDLGVTERALEDAKTRYQKDELVLNQLMEALKPLLREDDTEAIANQEHQIEIQKLNMTIQQRELKDLEQQILDGRVLRAPYDGVVTELTAKEGITVSAAQQVCIIASDDSGYKLDVIVSEYQASTLRIGGEVKVNIDDGGVRVLDGIISSIENQGDPASASASESGAADPDSRAVTIDVNGTDLKPGLKATAYIHQESQQPGFMVPADVMQSDLNGTYLFTVSVTEGPLGSSYFAKKTYVNIGAKNNETVVITNGLLPEELFITDTSEPLSDGNRVRLE